MKTDFSDVKTALNDIFINVWDGELDSDEVALAISQELRDKGLDQEALQYLLAKLFVPHARAAYSKQSEGVSSAQTLITLKPIVGPVTRTPKPGQPLKFDNDDILRYAVVDGIPLLEHTVETLQEAIAKNSARAAGYLAKNDKLSKLQDLLVENGAETLAEVKEAAIEVWRS